MADNTNSGFSGTNFIANMKASMAGMGVSAASASQALSNFAVTASGFPSPDDALDRAMALDNAMEQLREGEGPPDAIRVLAAERAKELGVQVSFARRIYQGAVEWQVNVRTKRGTTHGAPYLSDKQKREIAEDFLVVEAWKNAMRDAGLL